MLDSSNRLKSIMLALLCAGLGAGAAAQCPSVGSGFVAGRVTAVGSLASCPVDLNEISGTVWSRRLGDVLWVHEDSGAANVIYAQPPTGGNPSATITLEGASNNDWEDITIGPGPTPGIDRIYVGDIGDNGAGRSNVSIYAFDEPSPTGDQTIPSAAITRMTLTYPNGARDAEALMCDPVTGDLFIVQKRGGAGQVASNVYRKAWPHNAGTFQLELVGTVTMTSLIVAADISRDGTGILLKSVNSNGDGHPDAINYWTRSPGQTVIEALQGTPCPLPYISEGQGESVTFGYPSSGGCNYVTISEGGANFLSCNGQPINTFPINNCTPGDYPPHPGQQTPTLTPTPPPTPTGPTPTPGPCDLLTGQTFDAEVQGWTYADNGLTQRPAGDPSSQADVGGAFDPADGYPFVGSLSIHMNLSPIIPGDGSAESNMQGAYTLAFNMEADTQATLRVRYRIFVAGVFDAGEDTEAVVELDSTAYSVATVFGADLTADVDTGWLLFSTDVFLTAGTHTLRVGGLLTGKTAAAEGSSVNYDEIEVVCAAGTSTPTPTPTPTQTPCSGRTVGDFDCSGCTDITDFLFLLDNWLVVSPIGGGAIGIDDFLSLLDNWNAGAGC